MARPDVRTRRWTRIEYERLIEGGFFPPGDPVELLGGQLVVAEPHGSRHFAALRATQEALRAAFGAGWEIRGQGPLALDEESEPEPDLAAVPRHLPRLAQGRPRSEGSRPGSPGGSTRSDETSPTRGLGGGAPALRCPTATSRSATSSPDPRGNLFQGVAP